MITINYRDPRPIYEQIQSELRRLMRDVGGELMRIEGSETPTRSYAVSYTRDEEYLSDIREQSDQILEKLIDDMLDRVLNED